MIVNEFSTYLGHRGEVPMMSTCNGCGGHVSAEYARVFEDADGVVHRCPQCGPNGRMFPEDA